MVGFVLDSHILLRLCIVREGLALRRGLGIKMISLVFSGVWDRRGTFPLLPSSLWLDVTNSKSIARRCVIL